MDTTRDDLRMWLREAMTRTGDTASSLARRAGLAQSTLTRFLNSDDGPMLGLRSVTKISHVTGIAAPGFTPQAAAGAREARELGPALNAEPLSEKLDTLTEIARQAVIALVASRKAAAPWRLHTDTLIDAGYMPGDILVVDLNEPPRAGDAVCAQHYQWSAGRAETVWRIFEPPYLVAACRSPATRKPLIVDDERVMIKGVVIASVRWRAISE